MVAYEYQPLDLNEAQIRLLCLERSDDSAIIASVERFNFDDTFPTYKAISYTWGENVNGCILHIEGRILPVGTNLYRLLQILRNEGHGWLWIDQICIDQSNTKERNHQVRMMHQIYTRATGVIAWLGDSVDGSDLAMQFIADTAHEVIRASPEDHTDSSIQKGTRTALINLALRPYWSRLWILQEVIAAKKVDLMCGQKRVDWSCFERFFGIHRQFYMNHYPAFKKAHTIVLERSGNQSRALFSLLQRFTDWQCKDTRDKIYGLTGLVTHEIDLVVDYEKPVEIVLHDVLTALRKQLSVNDYPFDVKLSQAGILNNLAHLAIQLRINLAVFSISEAQLLEGVLSQSDRLKLAEIREISTELVGNSPDVSMALEIQHSRGSERHVNWHDLVPSIRNHNVLLFWLGELDPRIALDMSDQRIQEFYSYLLFFKERLPNTLHMSFPATLTPNEQRAVGALAFHMDLLSMITRHPIGTRTRIHVFKQARGKNELLEQLTSGRASLLICTCGECTATGEDPVAGPDQIPPPSIRIGSSIWFSTNKRDFDSDNTMNESSERGLSYEEVAQQHSCVLLRTYRDIKRKVYVSDTLCKGSETRSIAPGRLPAR
ncbi:ankyrin repeat and sam domain containing protein 6 [Paraphaeosphaeria sporulosa]